MNIFVVGGRQRAEMDGPEDWSMHERGLVARFDVDARAPEIVLDHVTAPERLPTEHASICFEAASVFGDQVYLCTKTEILFGAFPQFDVRGDLSHPAFNDVHHVRPVDPGDPDGDLWVVSTGLDLLLRVSRDGEMIRAMSLVDPAPGAGPRDPWYRHDPGVDYRRMASTKPHAVHANYVFTWDDQPWVTRFGPRDCAPLDDLGRAVPLSGVGVHDGIVHDGRVYFTSVDGHVIEADLACRAVRRRWNLARIAGDLRKPGWCRGLALIDDGRRALVGFSRLRPTRWKNNVSWLKSSLDSLKTLAHRPARVACFDLERESLDWEVSLLDVDMTTIFSIHVA